MPDEKFSTMEAAVLRSELLQGGLDARDLEDGVALAGLSELRWITLLGLKGLCNDLRTVGKRGNYSLLPNRRRSHGFKMMRCGCLLEAILDCL